MAATANVSMKSSAANAAAPEYPYQTPQSGSASVPAFQQKASATRVKLVLKIKKK